MGIVIQIKNFDMPIGCQKCKFFRKLMFGNGLDYSYSCILGAKEFPMPWIRQLDNRAADCPIIERAAICGAQQPCDDTISRQAAIDALDCINGVEEVLKSLPPAEPERKIGKWITVDRDLMVTSYKCSECGRTVRDDTGYDVIKDYPYCHCGAKMQEV